MSLACLVSFFLRKDAESVHASYFLKDFFVFTCGRRPTGHGEIPVVVVVVVVVGGNNFPKKGRGGYHSVR